MKPVVFKACVVVLAGILAGALAACVNVSDPGYPPCIDSLDCDPDQKCNLQTGYCVPIPNPQAVVDFELIPIKGSGTAETQIPEQDLASLKNISDVPLELATAVRVFGKVYSPEAMGGVPGNLVVNRHPEIVSRRLVWNIAVNESGEFKSDEVTPGRHDVLFKPSNRENFPQIEIVGLEINGDTDLTLALAYDRFPAEENLLDQDKLLLVRGQILQSQTSPHPVTGIEVEAVTDLGLRTSLVVPDEQGYFYLRLPMHRTMESNGNLIECQPQFLDITIRPVGDRRLPTVEVKSVELEGPELGIFYLGEEPIPYSLSGMVVDTGGNPVPDCRLRFEAENIGNGTYTLEIKSRSTGEFSTNLPEGTYQITAIPPLLSGIRMETATLVLLENTPDLIIMIKNRFRLTGDVTDSEGNQVADVIVRAKRLWTVSGVEDGLVRTYEGITKSNGTFSLPVDSGRYNVYFIPPAASGLPRQRPKRVYITDSDKSVAVTLPSPAVVQGHIYDKLGRPQCDVTINVYSSTETNAYLVGQTISDSPEDDCTGAYAVIIPAERVTKN
jgi:hypothetical protein